MEIILAHTKHGVIAFGNALALLKWNAAQGWYDDPEEYEWIINSNDEAAANGFLQQRQEYEYEGFEWVRVIE